MRRKLYIPGRCNKTCRVTLQRMVPGILLGKFIIFFPDQTSKAHKIALVALS